MEKKSQVWVETAIYTVIALAIISVLLAIAYPQIEKMKDKGIIKQTIDAINQIDLKISESEQAEGNARIVELTVSKGKFLINSSNDSIRFILEDSSFEFSQAGKEIREGSLYVKTENNGKKYNVLLTKYYENINITFDDKDDSKTLNPGATPYRIRIENKGSPGVDDKTIIDFKTLG